MMMMMIISPTDVLKCMSAVIRMASSVTKNLQTKQVDQDCSRVFFLVDIDFKHRSKHTLYKKRYS